MGKDIITTVTLKDITAFRQHETELSDVTSKINELIRKRALLINIVNLAWENTLMKSGIDSSSVNDMQPYCKVNGAINYVCEMNPDGESYAVKEQTNENDTLHRIKQAVLGGGFKRPATSDNANQCDSKAGQQS